jgi:hypothetical protein
MTSSVTVTRSMISVIPSSLSELFKEDESPLSSTVSRKWLNASFASARVIDTMMDGVLVDSGRMWNTDDVEWYISELTICNKSYFVPPREKNENGYICIHLDNLT